MFQAEGTGNKLTAADETPFGLVTIQLFQLILLRSRVLVPPEALAAPQCGHRWPRVADVGSCSIGLRDCGSGGEKQNCDCEDC